MGANHQVQDCDGPLDQQGYANHQAQEYGVPLDQKGYANHHAQEYGAPLDQQGYVNQHAQLEDSYEDLKSANVYENTNDDDLFGGGALSQPPVNVNRGDVGVTPMGDIQQ